MYLNYTNCINIYKKGYIYGILPYAIISAGYCAGITHTIPILTDFKVNPYIRFKFGLSVFTFIVIFGIGWPITLPLALISSITY